MEVTDKKRAAPDGGTDMPDMRECKVVSIALRPLRVLPSSHNMVVVQVRMAFRLDEEKMVAAQSKRRKVGQTMMAGLADRYHEHMLALEDDEVARGILQSEHAHRHAAADADDDDDDADADGDDGAYGEDEDEDDDNDSMVNEATDAYLLEGNEFRVQRLKDTILVPRHKLPFVGPFVAYRARFRDPEALPVFPPPIDALVLTQVVTTFQPRTLLALCRNMAPYMPYLKLPMAFFQKKIAYTPLGKMRITDKADLLAIDATHVRHAACEVMYGAFCGTAVREMHLAWPDRWGAITQASAEASLRAIRAGSGISTLFTANARPMPYSVFETLFVDRSLPQLGYRVLPGAPPGARKVVPGLDADVAEPSCRLASAQWCDFMDKAARTGAVVWSRKPLSAADGEDDAEDEDGEMQTTEFLVEHGVVMDVSGVGDFMPKPLVVQLRCILGALELDPNIRPTLLVGRFADNVDTILDLFVAADEEFPDPGRRFVICPTKATAKHIPPSCGYTVVPIRHAATHMLAQGDLFVIDSAHTIGAALMAGVLLNIQKSAEANPRAVRVVLCGADIIPVLGTYEDLCPVFARLVRTSGGIPPMYTLPVVSHVTLADAYIAPLELDGGLRVSTKSLCKVPASLARPYKVADHPELAQAAARTVAAVVQAARTAERHVVVLFDNAWTKRALEGCSAFLYSPNPPMTCGEWVIEPDGGQRVLAGFFEQSSSGPPVPTTTPTVDAMHKGFTCYRLLGDPEGRTTACANSALRPYTGATALACALAPADTVVLVAGAPYVKSADLDIAVYLAKKHLVVLMPGDVHDPVCLARREEDVNPVALVRALMNRDREIE